MSVVTESVVAPRGWLRYDVKRIRSVRHLTDPKHRPGPGFRPGGEWFSMRGVIWGWGSARRWAARI